MTYTNVMAHALYNPFSPYFVSPAMMLMMVADVYGPGDLSTIVNRSIDYSQQVYRL